MQIFYCCKTNKILVSTLKTFSLIKKQQCILLLHQKCWSGRRPGPRPPSCWHAAASSPRLKMQLNNASFASKWKLIFYTVEMKLNSRNNRAWKNNIYLFAWTLEVGQLWWFLSNSARAGHITILLSGWGQHSIWIQCTRIYL